MKVSPTQKRQGASLLSRDMLNITIHRGKNCILSVHLNHGGNSLFLHVILVYLVINASNVVKYLVVCHEVSVGDQWSVVMHCIIRFDDDFLYSLQYLPK